MHFDPNTFKKTDAKRAGTKKNILIYGDPNSGEKREQTELLKLISALIDDGHSIETVSHSPNPMTRRIINLRTPMKYARTTEFLGHYDHVIIFTPRLFHMEFRSTHIWGKTKEWFRHTKFLRQMVASGTHVSLVGTKFKHRVLTWTNRGLTTGHIAAQNAASSLYDHVTGTRLGVMDIAAAEKTVIEHANFDDIDGRFNPRKLERYLQATHSNDTDLRRLCTLASSTRLRQSTLVRHIRKSVGTGSDYTTNTLPPYPAIATAMALDKSNNLPLYATHLLDIYNSAHSFDLSSPKGQSDALNWYHTQGREKLDCFWVPHAEPEREDKTPKCSDEAKLISFFNTFEPTKIADSALVDLLNKRTHKSGPTGMAILLAMLCRIQLTKESIAQPWGSGEIANWFKDMPCKIAPNLCPFSTERISVITSNDQALIVGHGTQDTGLSVNMRMSSQAFDKIGLFHRNRELNGIGNAIPLNSKNTRRPKTSFALHHVNAERLPMTILTPDLAYRNDVYHIGYLLWETSVIPKVHKLGLDMIDEVWSPSNFVSDLYKHQGFQNVVTVGKAIPELDYLKKMSNITKPDNTLFTVFTAFDFHSSVERKNPMATLKAFQIAFPKKHFQNARLVVKSTPTVANHWGDPNGQIQQLQRAAKNDGRIQIIEKMLPLEYLFRLMARSDCIVSAHRGEGFGYIPAFGLALAKPTVVTNWGGVTDFCTNDTSFPVDASLVDVPKGHAIYDADGAKWADMDPDELAKVLRTIYENPSMANQRAQTGQEFINENYSLDRLSKTYQNRLMEIGLI